uniref:Uncharacterized protein n=1 Tax=Anopheles atroparvus TaxID=41427 RepID=A0A182J6R3_ANOAO
MFLHGTFRESDELDVVDLEYAIAPAQPAPLRPAARFDALHQQPTPVLVRNGRESQRSAGFVHHQQHLAAREEREMCMSKKQWREWQGPPFCCCSDCCGGSLSLRQTGAADQRLLVSWWCPCGLTLYSGLRWSVTPIWCRDGSLPRRTCSPSPSGPGSFADTSMHDEPPPPAPPPAGAGPAATPVPPPPLAPTITASTPPSPPTVPAPTPTSSSGGGSPALLTPPGPPPTTTTFEPPTWKMSGLPVPTELPLAPSPPPCCTPGSGPTPASS